MEGVFVLYYKVIGVNFTMGTIHLPVWQIQLIFILITYFTYTPHTSAWPISSWTNAASGINLHVSTCMGTESTNRIGIDALN